MLNQNRNIVLDDAPHDVLIDVVVAVNNAIPKVHDVLPFEFGMLGFELFRSMIGCLAHDLEQPR